MFHKSANKCDLHFNKQFIHIFFFQVISMDKFNLKHNNW